MTPKSAKPAVYAPDNVRALLKLATWYVRLRNPKKVDRLLALAIDLVENRGGMQDAPINRVLDDYANAFRRLNRPVEAGRLADLAQRVRNNFPDQFYPDGDDTPWWLQENFTAHAPCFPVEFHSSHAEVLTGWEWPVAAAALFAAMIVTLALDSVLDWLGGYVFLLWLAIPIVVGVTLRRRSIAAQLRRGANSWVRLTPQGVEYHDPQRHCNFRWPEVKHVWTSWESGAGEDVFYSSVVVVGPHDQFEVTARFFTEQQVRWTNGLCKLHSGQTTFEDWRERP